MMTSLDRHGPGQLSVHVVLCDSERLGHVLEGEAAVGLQQLSVSLDLHLTDVVGVVGVQVSATQQKSSLVSGV